MSADTEQVQDIELEEVEEIEDKVRALMQLLNCDADEISETKWGTYKFGREEYKVLDESEADTAYSEYLDNEIDELVMNQIPDNLQCYFDRDAYKRDSYAGNGRGTMASYDGAENEEKVNGEWYFIYRMN